MNNRHISIWGNSKDLSYHPGTWDKGQLNLEYRSHKKEQSSDSCYNMDKPWIQEAKWKKPDVKPTYGMIPFMRNVQKRQIRRERQWISGCQGLNGREGMGSYCSCVHDFFAGVMKCSGFRYWWGLYNLVYALKTKELYTFGWPVRSVVRAWC